MGRRCRLADPTVPVQKVDHGRYAWAIVAFVGSLALAFRYQHPSDQPLRIVAAPESDLDINDLLKYDNMTIEDRVKHFEGVSLGFVTPWNSKGYEFARKFAQKFTLISPVWYQVGPGNVLTGSHDVDEPWLEALRRGNVQVVPRFNLEGWQAQDIFHLLQNPKPFVDLIAQEVEKRHYDGVVLEATQAMLFAEYLSTSMTNVHIPSFAESVIAELGIRLKALSKKLIIVQSPDENISKSNAILAYSKYVSHFVVMTYDYRNEGRVGPNAPYNWVRLTINRILKLPGVTPGQVLLGLNFYGIDHVGDMSGLIPQLSRSIVAHDYIQLLRNTKNTVNAISFLESEKEHLLKYTDETGKKHSVFYPTLKSIHERVSLARELGVGIQIWEIGQGFECFFDLL